MALYDVTEHGAVGDGETMDTKAIQAAVDACAAAGGGSVLLPAGGRFLAGSFALRSHVELHVESGAVLLSSTASEDHTAEAFPPACAVPGTADRSRPGVSPAWIYCDGGEGIAVTGGGVIDGQGVAFMDPASPNLPYIYRGSRRRPMMFRLSDVRGLTFRDITLRDSANWAMNLSGCQDVLISGIRILNDLRVPNCDGIDPDHCRNVRISDCYVQAGDDCIVIKNRAEHAAAGPSENIVISNCVLCSTSSAVKIGTESCDDFRNIVVSGCVVHGSNRGLSIQLRDAGNVENVLFADCVVQTRLFHPAWWGRGEPIYVTAIPRAAGLKVGRVRNVTFRNILCRGESGVFIAGSEGAPIEDLVLDGVRVEVDKFSRWPGGVQDRRPCMSPSTEFGIEPGRDAGLREHPTAGVYAEWVRGLSLRDVRVSWGANRQEYWSHALECREVEGLRLEGFEGAAGREGLEARRIELGAS